MWTRVVKPGRKHHSGGALDAPHPVVAPLWEDRPRRSMEPIKIRLPMHESRDMGRTIGEP